MLSPKFRKKGARFNELFRAYTTLAKISKPSFTEHVNHLVKKKILKRKRKGKQYTLLLLNKDNIIANMGVRAVEEVNEKLKVLTRLTKRPDFWERLPYIVADFFALLELLKVKAALEFYAHPKRTFEYFTAVELYMTLEEDLILILRLAVEKAFRHPEHKQQLAKAIEEAIKELEGRLGMV